MFSNNTKHKARLRGSLVVLALMGVGLLACAKEVDKEKVDEAGAWSIAICKCAEKEPAEAKKCAAKHKEPEAVQQEFSHGMPTYKEASYGAYVELRTAGEQCSFKIEAADKAK